MNAIAPFVWKEWRAQRTFLGGYLLLTFASLICWFLLQHLRGHMLDHQTTQVVLSFVIGALAGLIVTAAQTVQAEFVGRDDQLLRRLPGALLPAFFGKLGFLLVAMVALVLLGLGVGQGLLLLTGSGVATFRALFGAEAWFGIGEIVWLGLLAVVWVFAIVFWMPNGRMAAGAALLLGFVLELAAENISMTCPGLNRTFAWRPWLYYLLPLAVAVGFAGSVRGRRGGDHRRSAQLGAATLIVGLLPPAGWLGAEVWEYRHPDLTRMVSVDLLGTTPDGRTAILLGTRRYEWLPVTFRVDLPTGTATQVTEPGVWLRGRLDSFSSREDGQRFWHLEGRGDRQLYDAVLGELTLGDAVAALPPGLQQALAIERAAGAPFRQPDNLPAWIEGAELCLQQADGSVRRMPAPWPGERSSLAGHGFVRNSGRDGRDTAFDLKLLRTVPLPRDGCSPALAIDGQWLLAPTTAVAPRGWLPWRRLDAATGALTECTGFAPQDRCIGILAEGEVLCSSRARGELFVYRPRDDTRQVLALPAHDFLRDGFYECSDADGARRPYGLRDRQGRMWVRFARRGATANLFLTVDPATHACTVALATPLLFEGLSFVDEHSVVGVEDCRRIVRFDLASGDGTVLFPSRR